MMANN